MPLPVLNGPLVSVYEAELALSLKDYGRPLHLAYSPAKRGACLPAGAVVWHFWVEQLLDHIYSLSVLNLHLSKTPYQTSKKWSA